MDVLRIFSSTCHTCVFVSCARDHNARGLDCGPSSIGAIRSKGHSPSSKKPVRGGTGFGWGMNRRQICLYNKEVPPTTRTHELTFIVIVALIVRFCPEARGSGARGLENGGNDCDSGERLELHRELLRTGNKQIVGDETAGRDLLDPGSFGFLSGSVCERPVPPDRINRS